MALPKVSIITIVYNGVSTLENTIKSIAALTYPNVEYIVVDGGSKDGTVELIQRYESNISKWISEPDKGLYDAMNKGLAMASGDYVWFINSGDETAEPNILNKTFALCNEADIYYGDTMLIDSDGHEIGKRRLSPPKKLTWKDFRKGMVVSHQSFICSRSIAGEYNLAYRFSADFEWCLQALKKADRVCNTELTLSRFLEGGLTKKNIVPGLKERFKIMRQNYGLIATTATHIVLGIKLCWFILMNKRF